MAEARINYYRAAEQRGGEEHPIDEAVARRLRHGALRQRIRQATDEMVEALGAERDLWVALESFLGDYQIDREEEFFNIGYEHGLVAGRTEALKASVRRPASRHRALTAEVARLAANAGSQPTEAAAALIEIAWAILVGARLPNDQLREHRKRRSK